MFYCLKGDIIRIDAASVVIECSGVGFFCNTTANTVNKIGTNRKGITLYTHLNVREDALDLFGFYDEAELDFFRLLISVTGVGPKAALAILSEFSVDKLAICVASGDAKALTRASGVGNKIAQRIVLELKDKLKSGMPAFAADSTIEAASAAVSSGSNASEAVAALTTLGYSQSDAAVAVGGLDQTLSAEELIKRALKLLARLS